MKVQVLSPTQGGPFYWAKTLADELNHQNIRAVHSWRIKDLLASPFIRDTDIIHAAVPLFFSTFRKPIVLTVKGDIFAERRRWQIPYLLAMKRANVITTPSRYLKERLHLEDAHVIPNAVCPQTYKVVGHCDKSVINILMVTNFAFRDKSEGVIQVIETLERVRKSTEKLISFTVVGGGPFLAHVQKRSRKFSLPVRFTGFIQRPRNELERSDIFLYSSPHDNFPNVLLEAMASGLPVVTNNVGAVGEIIESGSTGFVAESVEEYENLVLRLISDPILRAEQGVNARKSIEERFDWKHVVQDYITLYRDLLSRR